MDRAASSLDDEGDATAGCNSRAPSETPTMSPDPNATVSQPAATPTPTVQSPPPPPAPAPAPTTSAGGVGVTPAGGASSPSVPPTAPQLPADVQAQITRYQAMEREYQQLAQHQHLIPLGMEAYRRAQQAQTQPAAQAAPTPQHPWGVPQFDERLLDFVGRDPTTNQLTLLPGAPPDALIRVQEYQAKVREANNNFLRDPEKALAPIIEKMFGGLFEKQFGEQYGQIQSRQTSERILADNRDWLVAKDQGGNYMTRFNPATGGHDDVLSPLGEAYSQQLVQATRMGIGNPADRHSFAVTNLQNFLFQQQRSQQAAQATGVQQQQQVLQQGQQTAAAQVTNFNPNVNPQLDQAMSLRDQFRKNFEANGVTDAALAQQMNRVA